MVSLNINWSILSTGMMCLPLVPASGGKNRVEFLVGETFLLEIKGYGNEVSS
jgi:hypothetical protein